MASTGRPVDAGAVVIDDLGIHRRSILASRRISGPDSGSMHQADGRIQPGRRLLRIVGAATLLSVCRVGGELCGHSGEE